MDGENFQSMNEEAEYEEVLSHSLIRGRRTQPSQHPLFSVSVCNDYTEHLITNPHIPPHFETPLN